MTKRCLYRFPSSVTILAQDAKISRQSIYQLLARLKKEPEDLCFDEKLVAWIYIRKQENFDRWFDANLEESGEANPIYKEPKTESLPDFLESLVFDDK